MIRTRGKVTIHALKMSIPYVYESEFGIFTFGVNLQIPDHEIRRVAVTVATYFNKTVMWQDIVGRLHRVDPNEKVSEFVVFVDPRSQPNRRNKRSKK